MKNIRFGITIIIGFAFMFASCKKETLKSSNCEALKRGLMVKDVNVVRNALGDLLTSYSRENLNKLVATVSERCNITASTPCFNCIYTDPMQTEIRFSPAFAKLKNISSYLKAMLFK